MRIAATDRKSLLEALHRAYEIALKCEYDAWTAYLETPDSHKARQKHIDAQRETIRVHQEWMKAIRAGR